MYPAMWNNPVAIVAVILVIVLLFGANKIPELARGVGLGLKEFKKGIRDADKDDELEKDEDKERRIRQRIEEEMRLEEEAAKKK